MLMSVLMDNWLVGTLDILLKYTILRMNRSVQVFEQHSGTDSVFFFTCLTD